jgi:hypothetical protein
MPSWKAIYSDGTSLSELNDKGIEIAKYDQIDRSKLAHFIVIGDDGKVIIVLHLRPTSRLIWRQRVEQDFQGNVKARILLVGWQETRGGENFQSITAIFPDHMEIIDRFYENHPWFYPVTLRSEEQ